MHRAHSGIRGIVNSADSYENIHRFLFGNLKAKLHLQDLKIHTRINDLRIKAFYDLEFSLSIQGTLTSLHQRQQKPCENAMRFTAGQLDLLTQQGSSIYMHTAFLNSKLNPSQSKFSHFQLAVKIVEYHVKERLLWDRQYDGRTIYSETLEIRLKDTDANKEADTIEYRWLSKIKNWEDSWLRPEVDGPGRFIISLLEQETVTGNLIIEAGTWPEEADTV